MGEKKRKSKLIAELLSVMVEYLSRHIVYEADLLKLILHDQLPPQSESTTAIHNQMPP